MNRAATVIALAGMILAYTTALGDESASQSRMSRRHTIAQLVVCMKKRMSDDKGISFIEARNTCKDQIANRGDSTPSGTLVASATAPKP
jgi:hypothetical protein